MVVAAEAAGMQLIDHRFTPARWAGVAIEIKVIALSDHRLEAMGAVVVIAGGYIPLVDIPPDGGRRDPAALWWVKNQGRLNSPAMHPVAVAAAKANSLHLNVPVITAAVLGIELNDLIRSLALPLAYRSSSTLVA